jgi:cytochrome c-type biogenesis protein CcmH/NrfG
MMAAVCLVVGVLVGYLFPGSQSSLASSNPTVAANGPAPGNPGRHMPSLDQMKHIADKQAEPLLAKLKTDPYNADLLVQIAKIYKSTHQFQEATGYFERALKIDPKSVTTRTEIASCLYYTGDVDGAISQLQQSLKDDPNNANSLFNLGVIQWQGKKDAGGAIAAWQQLLKSNRHLEGDKRAQVEKLIAEVRGGNAK